jgi:hypothetical protein
MQSSEKKALRELYLSMAVGRALEEIDAIFNCAEEERERDHELEAELKQEARAAYGREREQALANDDEFELVWGTIREDILREVRALEAMR